VDQLGRLDPVTGAISDVEDFSGVGGDLRGLGADVDGYLFSTEGGDPGTTDLHELGHAPPFGHTFVGQYGDSDVPVSMDDVTAHGLVLLASDDAATVVHEIDPESFLLLRSLPLSSPDDVGIHGVEVSRGFPALSFFDIAFVEVPPDVQISWSPVGTAATYDVVRGDLGLLRQVNGNFGQSVLGCVADDTTATSVTVAGDPPPGSAFYYLVRSHPCGTYDDGSESLAAGRDASIAASGNACGGGN
jgi:hypothetical protein